MNLEARSNRYSRETWKSVFGPRHYAFQYAGATFILLDNVHYFGHNSGAPRSGQYCGLIGERQLQFVRNVLAHVPAEQLVVVSMHIPLATYQDPANPADNTADRLALLELLSSRPHVVSFSGHMHLTEHHYLAPVPAGGTRPHHHHVLAAASGGWWGGLRDRRGIPFADSPDGSPNGYHVLSIDGCHYETRFMPSAGKPAGQLRAMVRGPLRPGHPAALTLPGGPIAADALRQCELLVNVFDGGPRTTVAFAIAGGDAAPMQRVRASDPFITELCRQDHSMQKPWVKALPSSHLWRAPLGTDVAPGTHRLTIRVNDEYGREHLAHLVLEVSAPTHA
jgi:hypothetical protein